MTSVDFYKVGTLICQLRKEKGLTQQKLANILGKSKPAICQWEAGMGIKSEEIYNIAKFFDITVDELIEGKLVNESNESVWRRIYDINSFDLDEDISEENIDKLKRYYECCKNVKKRFIGMLPRWANGMLTKDELNEFEYLKQYFEFDYQYWCYEKFGPGKIAFHQENDEKELVSKIYFEYHFDVKEYEWQISKVYNFKPDLKIDKVCESKSPRALELLLSVINQVQKDLLFNANLKKEVKKEMNDFLGLSPMITKEDYSLKEIENIWFFKIMLNCGCNIMYAHMNPSNQIDEDEFLKMSGTIKEVKPKLNDGIDNLHMYMDFTGIPSYKNIKYWKKYSLKEYELMIDCDKTSWYRDIVNLKNSNPYQYYKNYVRRNEVK